MRDVLRRIATVVATIVTAGAATGLVLGAAPAGAAPAPVTEDAPVACELTWGSRPESGGSLGSPDPITDVRAGRHECFDRFVIDVRGDDRGYDVRYVKRVRAQGSGAVVALRGGAFLQIDVHNPAYDPETGDPTYVPADPRELVGVAGWTTFRQAAWGGSYEGTTRVGLGVRARLPFRVLSLDGPGSGSRIVVDVAHHW